MSIMSIEIADRKSDTYNLTLEWSWPWNNIDLAYDLDLSIFPHMALTQLPWHLNLTQIWSRSTNHTRNESFCVNSFKTCSPKRQTDKHYENITFSHTREVKGCQRYYSKFTMVSAWSQLDLKDTFFYKK